MKVVFLKNSKFGKKYEVKDISPGLARNILIPKGEAELATPDSLKRVEKLRASLQLEAQSELALLDKVENKLKDLTVEISVKAGEEGQLFSKLTAEEVAKVLSTKYQLPLKAEAIHFKTPVKHIGLHTVSARLGGGREIPFTLLLTS